MAKLKAKREIEYSKWNDNNEIICCCSYRNPLCSKYKDCELIEVIIDPYDNIDNISKNDVRRYKRKNRRIIQI